MRLTADAERLYAVLSHVFSRAAEAVETIRSGTLTRRVTLASTHAFAQHWLMPRMGDFWRRYPEITVDHLMSDDARDFRRSEVNLRIRYGLGGWPDETAELLLTERILPISGPDFARRHADCTPADIPDLPLLHVDWVDAEWTGWGELLTRMSIPHGPLSGRRFITFSVVLQACQDEQGVAVGWYRLVRHLVDAGKLVPSTGLSIPAPGSYYLTWNTNRELNEATRALKNWLLDMAARAGS